MVKIISRANVWRVIIFTGIVWCLSILAIFSVFPFFFLRHFLLPTDNFRAQVDFVSKNVTSLSGFHGSQQLVSLSELKELDLMSMDNYKIDLELTLPRNDINRELGPFAIKGALGSHSFAHNPDELLHAKSLKSSKSGTDAEIVERMAMLPYKSDLIEKVDRVSFLGLYVTDFRHEESVIKVTLWNKAYKPKSKHPFLLITIPREVWVSKAEVIFTVRLRGLKYYLKEHPIISFVVISFWSFIFEVCAFTIAAGALYLKLVPAQEPQGYHSLNDSRFNDEYFRNLDSAEATEKLENGNETNPLLLHLEKLSRERQNSTESSTNNSNVRTTQYRNAPHEQSKTTGIFEENKKSSENRSLSTIDENKHVEPSATTVLKVGKSDVEVKLPLKPKQSSDKSFEYSRTLYDDEEYENRLTSSDNVLNNQDNLIPFAKNNKLDDETSPNILEDISSNETRLNDEEVEQELRDLTDNLTSRRVEDSLSAYEEELLLIFPKNTDSPPDSETEDGGGLLTPEYNPDL